MQSFQEKEKNQSLKKNKLLRYLRNAIGEIILIIIGILIAVKINDSIQQAQNAELRCTYLNELLYTFEYDIKDVEENIDAFEKWNPQIKEIYVAIQDKRLAEVDSVYHKFGTVGNFIFFGQRSKTKIEELKYSNINLIENRDLKNKILLYQDGFVSAMRVLEGRYELVSEDLRQYYTSHFKGFNYSPAIPLDIKKLEKDNRYSSLVLQRFRLNNNLKNNYKRLNKDQNEIRELIIQEIERNCK